jgi:hypothetical protein
MRSKREGKKRRRKGERNALRRAVISWPSKGQLIHPNSRHAHKGAKGSFREQ